MKKTFATLFAIMIIASVSDAAFATDNAGTSDAAGLLPIDVIQNIEQSEIRKVYELNPTVDPGRIPRESFERSGYIYECTDMLREVVIGEESKTVTVTETAESKKNDSNTVLGLFPQYREYSDEEGFAGTLLLNTATVRSEVSGYGTSSTPYTISRSYPNLSDADTQYIPKTVDDNGRTLRLQDVRWQTDNTMNADDYEISDRYTAVVTYVGTKTSGYVKGYNVTADYSGEVLRKGVTVIRYTVIFTGAEVPAPDADPARRQNGGIVWPVVLISILALLGCGICIYLMLKNRKETHRHEEVPNHEYPDTDTYADDIGSDAGVGGGDR